MQKTLGGDRLGSGKKMKVQLKEYERSTHDMGYIWRSSMAAGTIVPFFCEVATPGDTFDISLDCDIKTHPTIGPLFGSYKVELYIFEGPVRLYQGQLHNNKLGIGMNMANVKLPIIELQATKRPAETTDIDNWQINPSCLLSYTGIRGVGSVPDDAEFSEQYRTFNAVPMLMYWDTYKNYFANKQEESGIVIHNVRETVTETVDEIRWTGTTPDTIIPTPPAGNVNIYVDNILGKFEIDFTGTEPGLDEIIITTNTGQYKLSDLADDSTTAAGTITVTINPTLIGRRIYNWMYVGNGVTIITEPGLQVFPLEDIDKMREAILGAAGDSSPFKLNDQNLAPYKYLLDTMTPSGLTAYVGTQEGLAIKTYNSDLLNNWLSTEWIDGPGGISEVTAIDTSGGSFQIDTFLIARKVYNMLNRIMVSGGSYDDWQDVVWTHERYTRCESPIFHGGLIKELIFQEVVSNSESTSTAGTQPLGTLAGKGTMAHKHKGGHVTIKVNEISYIMGFVMLTPRLDYSQGNKWDVNLQTMDDFHKPELDQIGFQELIMEQGAWWSTKWNDTTQLWEQQSAGKQPAWINYMTNINQTRGNFAIANNEMFMTLNRRYEQEEDSFNIKDLTTYIDPSKFNYIFAQTSLDSQNFWVQIAVDATVRRKMSAKVMPNL